MKNILLWLGTLLCVLGSGTASAAATSETKYVDAATLTLVNKAHPTTQPFHRVEVADFPDLSKTVRLYYTFSTGVAVVFRTDSRAIRARWTTTDRKLGTHMTGLSQKGMDMYIKRDGQVDLRRHRPSRAGRRRPPGDHRRADGRHREGVPALPAAFRRAENARDRCGRRCRHRSRTRSLPPPDRGDRIEHHPRRGPQPPGLAYPAQLERATGLEFVNLGASGQCKMDQFFAHVAAACEADAFLFDCFSNPSAQLIEERLDSFVRTIRAAHPTKPLIFLQTELRETRNFNDKIRKYEDEKRATSEAGMRTLLRQDKNIYFINPGMPLGDDHEATVDGLHPSDLGHDRILEVIRPQIVKILRKYDIR